MEDRVCPSKKGDDHPTALQQQDYQGGGSSSGYEALLSAWNPGLSSLRTSSACVARTSWARLFAVPAEDILADFRQRYLVEETVCTGFGQHREPPVKRNTLAILYFHSVRATCSCAMVIELLVAHWSRGVMEIDVQEIESALRKWVEEEKFRSLGDSTVRRVTQGVLSHSVILRPSGGSINESLQPTCPSKPSHTSRFT